MQVNQIIRLIKIKDSGGLFDPNFLLKYPHCSKVSALDSQDDIIENRNTTKTAKALFQFDRVNYENFVDEICRARRTSVIRWGGEHYFHPSSKSGCRFNKHLPV